MRATFRDNDSGNNSAYSMQDVVEVDPPADRRREQAELVALLVHLARAEIDPAVVTGANGVRVGWEITRDEDIGLLTQNRQEIDLSNNATEGSEDPGSPLSRQVVIDSHDPLWFALLRTDRQDDAAGDNQQAGPWYIDYRRLTGGGPVFSGGDSLHVHCRQNKVENTENFVGDIQFTAIWSVTDRD